MKITPYLIYIVLLLLLPASLFSQERLKEGFNDLEDKSTTLGKLKCEIIPTVKYYSEKPDHLEITFKVKWFNKKAEELKGLENKLFLFDDKAKYEQYIRKNRNKLEYRLNPLITLKNPDFRSIEIENHSSVIPFNSFESGYLIFSSNSSSVPIVIDKIDYVNALIRITFRFAYVKVENKHYDFIDIASSSLSWKFFLPEIKAAQNCNEMKKKYASKVEKIKLANNMQAAIDLKLNIESNPDLNNCPEIKNSFVAELNKVIADSKEIAVVEEQKSDPEKKIEKPKEVKKTSTSKPPKIKEKDQWKKYEAEYEKSLVDFNLKYNDLHLETEEILTELNQVAYINSKDIIALQNSNIGTDKQIETDETLRQNYDQYNDVNTINKSTIKDLINKINTLHSKLINKQNGCTSDFTKVDKKEGQQRSQIFMVGFSNLISDVDELLQKTEDVQNIIVENENSLLRLMKDFNEDTMIIILNLKEYYDSVFTDYYATLLTIDTNYQLLRKDFENKRYSGWYFITNKNKFIGRTDKLYNQLISLQNQDSSTKIEKDTKLTLHNFNVNVESQQNFDKLRVNLQPAIQFLRSDIENWPTRKFPTLYLILLIVLSSILIFGGRIYWKALQARKLVSKPVKATTTVTKDGVEKTTSGGITLTKTITNKVQSKGIGLDEVRKKAGIDFLELDLNFEWDDTSVKKIYFARDCIIKTYRFFEDSIHAVDNETTANETGGYLIGRWDFNKDDRNKFDVSLEDFIEPGDDAVFSRYQLNFGAKIAVKLQKALENRRQKVNGDFVLTAWFHSHPGLKIFLSDYDLTVQTDFSKNDEKFKMVALVIDPYTEKWDTGIFTYQSTGLMNNSKDSKQFFSLDNMYKWALGPVNGDTENYFSTSLSKFYPDSVIETAYFSNPCILEIKRHIEDNTTSYQINDLMVFLTGDKILNKSGNYDIVFKKLHHPNEENIENQVNTNILGCLIKSASDFSNIKNAFANPEIIKTNLPLVFAYCYDDNSVMAISKNINGVFNDIPKKPQKIKFIDMVAWTRKRK